MAGIVRRTFSLGFGIASMAKDAVEDLGAEIVDSIRARGLAETAEGRRLVGDVRRTVRQESDRLRRTLRSNFEKMARDAGLASDNQIKALNRRIAYLENELRKRESR